MGVIQDSIDKGITVVSGIKTMADKQAAAGAKIKQAKIDSGYSLQQKAFNKLYKNEAKDIDRELNEWILSGEITEDNYNEVKAKMYLSRIAAKQNMEAEIESNRLNKQDTTAHMKKSRKKSANKV